jgi:hypothetical protein
MELNSEQYERIARWLDGEAVELAPEERAAAREVRAGEAGLKAALGEPAAPARAMERASRRLRAALSARPGAAARRAVRGRYIAVAAAGAAVAAALVIVSALGLRAPQPAWPAGDVSVPTYVWVGTLEDPPGGVAIHMLAREVDRFAADLAVSRAPSVMDWQIDSVQHELDNFWQEEPSWEPPEG